MKNNDVLELWMVIEVVRRWRMRSVSTSMNTLEKISSVLNAIILSTFQPDPHSKGGEMFANERPSFSLMLSRNAFTAFLVRLT